MTICSQAICRSTSTDLNTSDSPFLKTKIAFFWFLFRFFSFFSSQNSKLQNGRLVVIDTSTKQSTGGSITYSNSNLVNYAFLQIAGYHNSNSGGHRFQKIIPTVINGIGDVNDSFYYSGLNGQIVMNLSSNGLTLSFKSSSSTSLTDVYIYRLYGVTDKS